MIRLARWDVAASTYASSTAGARGDRTIDRLSAPVRGPGFWLALWAVAIGAEFAALVPVIWPGEEPVATVQVIYRLIGGSFAACGLIAWRRRPDSRSGLLMAGAGVGFFLSAIVGQFDAPIAQTGSILVQEMWAPFFVALLLTLLTGGRLASRVDWLLVGGVRARAVGPAGRVAAVLRAGRQPAGRVPERRHRRRGRQGPAHAGRPGLRGRRDRGRGALDGGVAPAPARTAAERRRQHRAAALRRAADQRPRDGLAVADRPLAGDLLARQRARRLPRRPPALAPGPRRPGRPLPRPARHERRRPAGGAGQDARRPEPRRRLPPPRVLGYADADGPPGAGAPGRRQIARPRWSRATAPSSPRSCTTPRSTTIPSWSRPSAPRRRIALENERLQAEAQSRLAEVQASRERIVAAERRRAPAPGAQPARRRPAAPGRAVAAAAAARGPRRRRPVGAGSSSPPRARELAQSLAELRELARGIHPAVLDHGLAAALDSLAARSPVPTSVAVRGDRPPARAGRARGLLRGLRGADQRRQVRAGDRRVACASRARRHAARSSRSPTTASAAPTTRAARACAASPIASRRSTAA